MLQKRKLLNKISRIFMISGSGSGNTLLNIINHQTDIGTIYLHANDPNELKYKFLMNKPEKVGSV